MSTNKTPNYQLNQWVKTDQVLMDEFNADNSKIDAALDGLSGQVAAKADQSNLEIQERRINSLNSIVSGKASQSALNSLSNQVAQLGNCQIDFFTYTGNGKYSTPNPTKITFPRKPLFFVILGREYYAVGGGQHPTIVLNLGQSNGTANATWSGNQLSFWANGAEYQMNASNTTYGVIALSAMD